jgi:hypothetical protein
MSLSTDSNPLYRAGTIKRRRRTRAEVEQLDNQIITALHQDHPQSVRHVFYLMTNPRLPVSVPKTDKGANNGYRAVQDRIVKLRRSGKLPYSWITDATRRGYHTPTYRSVGDFLRSISGHCRADLWQQAEVYCEVWTESRSIAGVVQEDCEELAVSLYPAGGFSSISLAHSAAQEINFYAEDKKAAVIFYIGDYDPAGVLIDVALERELREHLHPDVQLDFRRLAITPEQIWEHDLPTKPRKEKDRRSAHVTETVEAEAMPAGILRALLRREIEALLPPRALHVAKVEERSRREHIERMAELVGGAS